ncbi:MAG: hypothetical protein AAFW73_01165 [Bacteroidota bacterium]
MNCSVPQPSHPLELIDRVYEIIDSKIQYIDYQTELVTSSFVDINTLGIDPARDTIGRGASITRSIMANNRRILEKISEFSATTKLLLVLRAELDHANAPAILELLTDNKFIQLTDQELQALLQRDQDEAA